MGIVWTLRARGLAQSLGAGGSLVVAGLCCLLLVSAMLTFRDWPGGGEGSVDGTVTMPAPPGKAAGRAASGPSAANAAAPPAASSGPARSRSAAPASARRPAARRRAAAPVPAGVNPPAAAAPAPVAAPAPAAARPAPAAQAPVPVQSRPEPQPAPGPVEGVVETVRGVQDPLPLPPVVREPVQPVLDTVQAVGHTVDQAAGPLLQTLP